MGDSVEWIEVDIITTSFGIEVVSGMLIENGITGIQIEDDLDLKNFLANNTMQWDYVDDELQNKVIGDTLVKFYVSNNAIGHETLIGVRNSIENLKCMKLGIDLGILELKTKNVNDEDWINIWKKYYKPFKIGEKIIIKPTWEEYKNKENEIIFTINPGHVFGTGLHQSTQLCIEELEKYVTDKSTILDLGCGSGILSIIGLLLGAKDAYAIDIDANAVDVAYENADLNNISKDKYTVVSGNVLKDNLVRKEICSKKYSIVVANIVADIIIELADFIPTCLEKDGIFISSGIIKERIDDVVGSLKEKGFEIIKINNKDGWVCVVAKQK